MIDEDVRTEEEIDRIGKFLKNISIVIGLSIIVHVIVFFLFNHPQKLPPPSMDVSGLSEAEHSFDANENKKYTIITTSREVYYTAYMTVSADTVRIDGILASSHSDGRHWKFYASFNGLPPEDWLLESGNVDLLQEDLSGIEVTILKSTEIKEVPPEIRTMFLPR